MTTDWKSWNPGLDNDELTLGEVHATLPGNDPESISFIVRLFENPSSPVAFKGAISLERHDCVHLLLGRGLQAQDEAFVIGYTMGTSQEISEFQATLFSWITKYLYPKTYKFTDDDLVVYQLGMQLGRISRGTMPVYDVPLEEMHDRTLGDLRQELDICSDRLKRIYACERELLPGSPVSQRLPV